METKFYKDKTRADGLRGYCKVCDRELHQEYTEKNREHLKEYRRGWYKKQPASKMKKQNRKSRVSNIGSALISAARSRARKKGVPFDLDNHKEQIIKRVNAAKCELTGMPLNPAGRKSFNSVSLDRIRPELGYIYSNVRVVAYSVNCALGTWGEAKLMEIARLLLKEKN